MMSIPASNKESTNVLENNTKLTLSENRNIALNLETYIELFHFYKENHGKSHNL